MVRVESFTDLGFDPSDSVICDRDGQHVALPQRKYCSHDYDDASNVERVNAGLGAFPSEALPERPSLYLLHNLEEAARLRGVLVKSRK